MLAARGPRFEDKTKGAQLTRLIPIVRAASSFIMH